MPMVELRTYSNKIVGIFRASLRTVYLVQYTAVTHDIERGLEVAPSCADESSLECRMVPSAII